MSTWNEMGHNVSFPKIETDSELRANECKVTIPFPVSFSHFRYLSMLSYAFFVTHATASWRHVTISGVPDINVFYIVLYDVHHAHNTKRLRISREWWCMRHMKRQRQRQQAIRDIPRETRREVFSISNTLGHRQK